MKLYFTIIIFTALCSILALGDIVHVPQDQPTIQAGINAAVNGDTVLVDDSTYYENINFKGKAITVASHFIMDGDTNHINNTIIDGSQPSNPDSGSVVYFLNGEDTTSVLCGFTITGGTGTRIQSNNHRLGGGVCVINSGAYIRNNHIEFNTINHTEDAFGGGIFGEQFPGPKNFIIEKNIIRKNNIISAIVVDYSLGGGIYSHAYHPETIRISGNKIINNTITAPVAYGGGILPGNSGGADYLIKNNLVSGNVIDAQSGGSGGIDIYNQFPVLHNNVIANNSAPSAGAMWIEFTSEEARTVGMRGAGAIRSEESIDIQTQITDLLNLSNNTIVGNSAAVSGGGILITGSTIPTAMNFIVWGNIAPSDPQISGFIDIRYSDIEGGYTGPGNIDDNPQFQDSINYYLSLGSPCIDAGDPAIFDPEDPLNPGFALFPAMGTLRSDMGAYGGPGSGPISGISIDEVVGGVIPQGFTLFQNYPNPFNPSTTIEFSIPHAEFVTLKVYNILGEEVATLVSEGLAAGSYKYDWDASGLASGVYLYRIQAGDYVDVKKMILLR